MPKMVTIEVDPAFAKRGDEEAAIVKAIGPRERSMELAYSTALENVRNSSGLYRIKAEEAPTAARVHMSVDDMDHEQLLLTLLNLGIKPQKRLTRQQAVGLVKKKMGEIEIVDEDDTE